MRHCLLCVMTVGTLTLVAWAVQDNPATSPQRAAPASNIFLGGVFPRLSPDGEMIACSYQGAIWRIPRRGGTLMRLTADSGHDIEPVWSPDGKRIAYLNTSTFGPGELRVIDSQTGKPITLPRRVDVAGLNAYQKLEFLSNTRLLGAFKIIDEPLRLGWLDLETGEHKAIFNPPRWGRFALSHDAQWIAYSSTLDVAGQQNGNDGRENDLWKIPVSGGEPKLITRFPSRVHDICWSADDLNLFVVSDFGGAHNDVWQVPLSDPERGARRVTLGQADEDRPSVSSDGRWMLFTDNRRSSTSLVVRDLQTGSDRDVLIDRLDYQDQTGRIELVTRDKGTQQPVTARVSILKLNGKLSTPPDDIYRSLGDIAHFYSHGKKAWELPAGNYLFRAYRGPEYRAYRSEFEIAPGKTTNLTIDLERWIDPAAGGWYSGENHIHANYGYGQWYNTPDTMLAQCAGEDLHVCNFMVANSDTDGVFDREFFRGRLDPVSTPDTLLYWNQEFRSTIWGHMTLLNLKQVVEPVFTGFKDTTNPWDIPTNSQIADRTHWQKGVVNYTHVAQNPNDPYENPYTGKGIPIDVALGKIDTLDLNASYAGTVPLWYRLLNCGFKLPASAGTDTFLNRIASNLPGRDRVYVKLNGPLSYEKWIEGLKAGRSFVTNGPILEFTAENTELGDTLALETERSVRMRGTAQSQFPMDKVEVVFNGKVIGDGKLASDRLSAKIDFQVTLTRGGWLSLRASGPPHRDHPQGTLDAHTSPIYVTVAGKGAASKADAEYFIAWLERLTTAIRTRYRIPDLETRSQVQQQFEAARAVYVKIAEEGE